MQLSTTISIYYKYADGAVRPIPDAIRDAVNAGFTVLDFPFHAVPFLSDGEDWHTPVLEARAVADSLGARFRYAHVPFSFPAADDTDGWAHFSRKVCRAIEAASVLGVEWAAIHPHAPAAPDYSFDAALAHNIEHLTPFVRHAREYGVGLAVENMCDRAMIHLRRFCATVEELITLVDALGGGVGVVLDTGHASESGLDHYASILKLGKKLNMLHINDNFGLDDDHLAPFLGKIRWLRVMDALREIGFEGDLNFEVNTGRIPSDATTAHDTYVAYIRAIGEYLVGKYNL
ncbi:MAG: sugar phosphate isomerase/epimerase [Clostridiaceae bacterium]|nr:sugar phosphate isomerase/epimerase [Clostridiaceae bacterium]